MFRSYARRTGACTVRPQARRQLPVIPIQTATPHLRRSSGYGARNTDDFPSVLTSVVLPFLVCWWSWEVMTVTWVDKVQEAIEYIEGNLFESYPLNLWAKR